MQKQFNFLLIFSTAWNMWRYVKLITDSYISRGLNCTWSQQMNCEYIVSVYLLFIQQNIVLYVNNSLEVQGDSLIQTYIHKLHEKMKNDNKTYTKILEEVDRGIREE